MDTIKLAGVVDLRATKPMRATIHAYSGGIMTPPGWGDVAIDLDGMAIPTTISILDAHENRNSAVIATGRARIDRGELTVDATFLSTAAGIEAAELIRAGTPLQASIGVRTLKTRTLEPGEDVQINGRLIEAGPAGLTLVTESKLQEVSLLPLGADDTTGVSIAARLAADRKDSEKMEFHEWLKAKKFDPANLEDEARDTLLKAYSAEAKGSDIHCEAGGVTLEDRQDARDTMTANLLRANPRQTTAIEHIKALADDEDWSPARLNLECYREMRSGPVIDNRPRAGSGAVMPEILQCAFVMHARGREVAESAYGAETAQRAEDLRCRSLHDIFDAAYKADGRTAPHDVNEMLRGWGPSTYDVSTIVGGGLEKIALDAYKMLKPSWPLYVNRVSVANFKEYTTIRINHTGSFEVVAPGGEIKHGTIGESTSTVQADTRGKLFMLDRRDIINDDLGMLTQTAVALGRMGVAAVSQQLWTLILGNTGNFFHSDNSNLMTGGASALDVDALSTAIQTLRKQVDANSEPLDLTPRTLVVSPELEAEARQILNSITLERTTSSIDNRPTASPIPKDLQLAVEPRISTTSYTGYSITEWYLFSAPSDAAVNVAFLNGREMPTVESVPPPANILGIAWRGFLDFGVGFGDPKAVVKSDGA